MVGPVVEPVVEPVVPVGLELGLGLGLVIVIVNGRLLPRGGFLLPQFRPGRFGPLGCHPVGAVPVRQCRCSVPVFLLRRPEWSHCPVQICLLLKEWSLSRW